MTTSILKVPISRRLLHYHKHSIRKSHFQKIFTLYHIIFPEDIHIIIHYFSKDIYIISHLISRRYSHLYIAFTLYHITFPGPLSNITITEGIHIISSCIFRRYSHYPTLQLQKIFTLSNNTITEDNHIIIPVWRIQNVLMQIRIRIPLFMLMRIRIQICLAREREKKISSKSSTIFYKILQNL